MQKRQQYISLTSQQLPVHVLFKDDGWWSISQCKNLRSGSIRIQKDRPRLQYTQGKYLTVIIRMLHYYFSIFDNYIQFQGMNGNVSFVILCG